MSAPQLRTPEQILVLSRIWLRALSSFNETEILKQAASDLVESLGALLARIWLVKEREGKIVLASSSTPAELSGNAPRQLALGEGRVGRIAAEMRSFFTNQFSGKRDITDPPPDQAEIISYGGFPLAINEKPLGVLELFFGRRLEAEEVELLANFGHLLARAVSNARLHWEMQRQTAVVEIIGRINAAIHSPSAISEGISEPLLAATEEIGAKLAVSCLAGIWGTANDYLYVQEHLEPGAPSMLNLLEIGRTPFSRYILSGSQPVVIEDTSGNPHTLIRELTKREQLRALCIVPIVRAGEVIGSIDLYRHSGPRRWLRSEVELAQMVAAQLSFAFESHQFRKEAAYDNLAVRILSAMAANQARRHWLTVVAGEVLKASSAQLCGVSWRQGPSESPVFFTASREGRLLPEAISIAVSRLPNFSRLLLKHRTLAFEDAGKFLEGYPGADSGPRIRSLLVSSIVVNDEVAGLLFLAYCAKTHRWTEEDIESANRLAQVLSLTLPYVEPGPSAPDVAAPVGQAQPEEISLEVAPPPDASEEAPSSAEEIADESALNRISSAIRDSLDEETILRAVAGELARALQASYCHAIVSRSESVMRRAPAGDSVEQTWSDALSVLISQSDSAQEQAEALLREVGQLLGVLNNSLQPVAVDDIRTSLLIESSLQARLRKLNVNAVAIAPIVYNNQIKGIIAAYQDQPRHWNKAELDLIGKAADQLAIAIKYVRLFKESEEQARRAIAVNNILKSIFSKLQVEQVIEAFAGGLYEVFQADQVWMLQASQPQSPGSPELECRYERSSAGYPGPRSLKSKILLSDCPAILRVINQQGPIAINDAAKEEAGRQFWERFQVKSSLLAAIRPERGHILIVAINQCSKTREWQEDDVAMLEELVSAAAAAIDNALAFFQVAAPAIDQKLLLAEMDRLSDLNKELEEIVYTASHDMRSPLISIQGFLLRIERELKLNPNPRITDSLERIKANTRQLQSLIDSLLDVSRLRARQDQDQMVDCHELVMNLTKELQLRLEEVGGEIIISGRLPAVIGSHLRLTRIFSNLLNNAINYRHPERKLRIEVGCLVNEGFYQFYVRDNGIGISEEHWEKVFQPLTRIQEVETQGTGMGLYIVKRIVADYGGRVWVESEKGKGSTFYFTLPAKARSFSSGSVG